MDASVYIERASLLLTQNRPDDAIREIKKALQEDPNNADAYTIYGRCLFAKQNYEEGMQLIRKAIAADPEGSYNYYLFGFGCYRKDLHDDAIRFLNHAIELDPFAAEYFGLLAFVYLDEKDFKTALSKADEGLAINPENITCLNARSMALNKMSKIDDAIDTMKDALAKDPDNEFTHATIGWNLLEKGRNKEAAMHFRESLRIDPDNSGAKTGLKEALKSKIPPYRWLLQFSFWLNNKGKTFRWVFIISILVGVRIISGLSKNNPKFESIGLIAVGAYFLFVATSWVINPLANVFLLFNKEGKYALNHTERWNAVGFIISMVSGILVLASSGFPSDSNIQGNLLASGFIILSVCIPAGHMHYPIRFRQNKFSQWLSILLIITAGLGLIAALVVTKVSLIFFVIYFLLFVIYTWSR